MNLDILDVLRTPGTVIERPIEIEPITLDDIEIVEPVRGTVRAHNARRSIVISGEASTTLRLACRRCLKSFTQPIEVELEAVAPMSFFQEYLHGGTSRSAAKGAPKGTTKSAPEQEIEEDEADDELASIFDHHHVDVLELVRQSIGLQAPLYALCSEACPGLPEATSYTASDDERWNALRKWTETHESSAAAHGNGSAR